MFREENKNNLNIFLLTLQYLKKKIVIEILSSKTDNILNVAID